MLTLKAWQQSVCSLVFEITQLNQSSNLLPEASTLRGHYFFADHGIPKPRPCTALAWASLCFFGPIQAEESIDLQSGHFLIPFLPKIAGHDEVNQSLPRQSKLHEKDSENRIRWGAVYIGDASSGRIIEQLPHGQRVAKEWGVKHKTSTLSELSHNSIPPLWAEINSGWQFGVIQSLPAFPVSLRDPMIELSKHGIPETRFGGIGCPRINRLLFRFLDIMAARAWAKAYSESMLSALDPDQIQIDLDLLVKQIEEKNQNDILDKESGKKAKGWDKKGKYDESILNDFLRMTGNGG